MKCTNCSTDLGETTNCCPHCGERNIAEERSITKETASGQDQTVSYLPAGAPSWPTNLASLPRSDKNGMIQMKERESDLATDPIPFDESAPFTPTKVPWWRRLGWLVLIPVIGSLILLGLLTVGGTIRTGPSATGGSIQGSAPGMSSFKTYSNQDINMSFQYPADWSTGTMTQEANVSSTVPVNPPQNDGLKMFISHLNGGFSGFFNDATELNRHNLQTLFQIPKVSNIQKVAGAGKQFTIAGMTWEETEATLQIDTSPILRFVTISAMHNGSYYSIYFMLADSVYQQVMQAYIQPLLNSIKFLS